MRRSDNTNTIPFFRLKNRPKTPSWAALECASKGWIWNGRKLTNREAWTNAVKDSFYKLKSSTKQ